MSSDLILYLNRLFVSVEWLNVAYQNTLLNILKQVNFIPFRNKLTCYCQFSWLSSDNILLSYSLLQPPLIHILHSQSPHWPQMMIRCWKWTHSEKLSDSADALIMMNFSNFSCCQFIKEVQNQQIEIKWIKIGNRYIKSWGYKK